MSEVADYKKGKRPKRMESSHFDDALVYLDIKAIEKKVDEIFVDKESSNLTDEKDLIVVWDGARAGWVAKSRTGALGSTIMALTPRINLNYLYRYLQTQFNYIQSNHRGTGIPHVDPDIFWNIKVPLSPLPEQHRIVAKLDALMGKIENNQQRLDKIPVLLKRFRQSVLAAAVSGRLTEDWREGNEISEEWNEKRIDEIFKVRTGVTPLRSNGSYYKNGTIPWAKTGEVKNKDIFEVEEKISQKAIDETGIKVFPINSILIAMYGEGKTRGSIGRLKIPSATNQACAVLINEELPYTTNQFVFLFLLSLYEAMRSIAVGGVRPNLNLDKIKGIIINLPANEEQHEIVRRVEQLFALADKIEARYAKAKAMLDKLSQSILAKAFRGELVPQNPGDEPASVLLERIRIEKEKLNITKKPKREKKRVKI